MSATANRRANWAAQLQQFSRAPDSPERCELCSAVLAHKHPHLVEPAAQRIICACTACALLFEHRIGSRFKRVPLDPAFLGDVVLREDEWQALGVPIDIAFFYESSAAARPVGLYPGAVGAVEASVDPNVWERLKKAHPPLASLAPDVEALLVNRMRNHQECYRMPIDRCYALAGMIRRHWRGFTGGEAVWRAIDDYFAQLRRELRLEASSVDA